MKVLLIDVDNTGFPNLALMKISAYYKKRGDFVGFNLEDFDKVFISVVFEKNKSKALSALYLFKNIYRKDVVIGGTGYDYRIKLPDKIEYMMPDYDLYEIDYGMGFTSRGCIRRCPFCIVPKKEGYIRHNQYIWEFLPDEFDKVVLLDNNFLASPTFRENIEYLIDKKIKVNFNQGLDLRLVNEENAKLLAETKYYDFDFRVRSLYFAWDWYHLERIVMEGIDKLLEAGIKPYQIMVYVLCGFNTTFEQDMDRVLKLKEKGVIPYVMLYNKDVNSGLNKKLRIFQRWVNRKYYQYVDWEDFYQDHHDDVYVRKLDQYMEVR